MRDCVPTSPDYMVETLSADLIDVGWAKDTIDYYKKEEELSVEEIREAIHTQCIKERGIWFESFYAGVTLDGKFRCA